MDVILRHSALYPDLAPIFEEFRKLHADKLWHELTLKVESFFSDRNHIRGDNFAELYQDFVATVQSRFNEVKLAKILSLVAFSYSDPKDSLKFLRSRLESKAPMSPLTKLCVEMDVIYLRILVGDIEEAKHELDDAKLKLNGMTERLVFSKYYRSLSLYYKTCGPPEDYYRTALTYLGYTPVEDISKEECIDLAINIALAAITGKDIYNFGEVIATPILMFLRDTPNAWIENLVVAFNNGEVATFDDIVETHKDRYFDTPVLAANHEKLKQKIVQLSVMNMVFERSSHDRIIPFEAISVRTRVPIDQVEFVLMRLMALGLIKGMIDQVDQKAIISWVQPRVLSLPQITQMKDQMGSWIGRVKTASVTVDEYSVELLV